MIKIHAADRLRYRNPSRIDGARLWELVKASGRLDINSPYFYLAMSNWFSQSCMLAENPKTKCPVGLIIGFRHPSNDRVLFIWQIAVVAQYRGQGIAQHMLNLLVKQTEIDYVEATISPSNDSSRRMFEKWAASKEANIKQMSCFFEEDFPNHMHEREDLYRIGPLNRN